MLRVLEDQGFGVQGLAGKSDEPAALSVFVIFRMVSAVANQGQPGIGSLGADLVFAPRFEAEAQLGDEARAASKRILVNHFKVGDGFSGFGF